MIGKSDPSLARALAALRRGDPLSALSFTEGRDDALGLALRATALAQVDETRAARVHLRRAERAFTALGEPVSALRARLAEAEVAVADLDLPYARTRLLSIAHALRAAGDTVNATWALVVAARAASLQGDAEGAELLLLRCRADERVMPPHVGAVLAIAEAELFAPRLLAEKAHQAAARARRLARRAAHPALEAEAALVSESLRAPIARKAGGTPLTLSQVVAIVSDGASIVVDACRARVLGPKGAVIDLLRRPVLFDLLVELALAAPSPVSVGALARTVFEAQKPNASHDARVRVELGRLRRLLGTRTGPIVQERGAVHWEPKLPAIVLLPLSPRHEARLRAILADGRAWPIVALAEVLGESVRTVQRRLAPLLARREITALGRGRARRYALLGRAPKIASWMLLAGFSSGG